MLSVSHALAYLISDQIMIQFGPLLFAAVKIASDWISGLNKQSEKKTILIN